MARPQRIEPAPGQESVWDYPRPPRVEPSRKHIVVVFNGVTLADTYAALRVLETSHPPVYYVPPQAVRSEYLSTTRHHSFCEFKGQASYYTLDVNGQRAENVAWYYPHPSRGYDVLKDHIAFYPGRMGVCYVDGERVQAQAGDFYGGWITHNIIGPFKGEPGTTGW